MEFYVVGPRRLQNELIASCLEREIGKECFIVNDLSKIQVYDKKREKLQRVVFWDCYGKDQKRLMADLKAYARRKHPENRIVLFNVPEKLGFEKEFVSEGIRGFFYEHDPLDIFKKGVGAVVAGKLWLSRDVMTKYIYNDARKNKPSESKSSVLTPRQIEIVAMIAVGATNDEIADKLCISPHTVKTHLYRIFKKINVPNRVQAALWAAKNL